MSGRIGRRTSAMGKGNMCFLLCAVTALHILVAEVSSVPNPSSTAIPAFVWSDLRCFGEQDRSISYEAYTSDSIGNTIFNHFGRQAAMQDSNVKDEAVPQMIVAFIGNELRSVDIARTHSSSPADLLETLQTAVAGAKYSLSLPYVSVSSDKTSVAESLLSTIRTEFGAWLHLGEFVVAGSCRVGKHDVKRLASVAAVQDYIVERKSSRAQGETDVLVVCYTPWLDWSLAGISMSEGEALREVLSTLKSSGTSNIAMYTSDPQWQRGGHHGLLARQLVDAGTGNTTTDCDALCRGRAVILEGIFVAIVLITILVSGLCCMKAVTSPSRFELPKES